MKELFENKPIGFIVTLASIGLTLITAIVYILTFSVNDPSFNLMAFILLLVSAFASTALIAVKKINLATYVLWIVTFLAFLFYIVGVYRYVVDVFVGIDRDHFEFHFIISTILFLLSVVGSTSTIFLKQNKEEQE